MVKRFVFLILFLVGSTPFLVAEEMAPPKGFEVRASVDESTITIGDKIRYEVAVLYPKDLKVYVPEISDYLGGFAIKDFGKTKKRKLGSNLLEEGFWYELDTYLVGTYIIPELIIKGQDTNQNIFDLKTPEIFIEVKSVIGEDDLLKDIRDLKGQESIDFDRFKWILITLLGLILLAGGIFGGKKYYDWVKRNKKEKSLPAHLLAMKELERIRSLGLVEKGEVKEFYFLFTNCLREYLEKRFDFRALEKTTEEFMEDILKIEILKQDEKELLEKVLESGDFVKFAKYQPEKEEIDQTFQLVENFINITKEEVAAA